MQYVIYYRNKKVLGISCGGLHNAVYTEEVLLLCCRTFIEHRVAFIHGVARMTGRLEGRSLTLAILCFPIYY